MPGRMPVFRFSKRARIKEEDILLWIELRRMGYKWRVIAEGAGVPRPTVSIYAVRMAKERGIPLLPENMNGTDL